MVEIQIDKIEKAAQENEQEVVKPKLDKKNRAYSTGKRKTSIARVWLVQGKGKISVNKKDIAEYFPVAEHVVLINQPFAVTDTLAKYDVLCTVKGGGKSGQASAIRHAIARALKLYNAEAYHAELRKAGLLTRDARIVERKKYGKKKARKSFQFSKR